MANHRKIFCSKSLIPINQNGSDSLLNNTSSSFSESEIFFESPSANAKLRAERKDQGKQKFKAGKVTRTLSSEPIDASPKKMKLAETCEPTISIMQLPPFESRAERAARRRAVAEAKRPRSQEIPGSSSEQFKLSAPIDIQCKGTCSQVAESPSTVPQDYTNDPIITSSLMEDNTDIMQEQEATKNTSIFNNDTEMNLINFFQPPAPTNQDRLARDLRTLLDRMTNMESLLTKRHNQMCKELEADKFHKQQVSEMVAQTRKIIGTLTKSRSHDQIN
ncbi:hypothetical protein OGAPHI_002837 [Ogataea philodendri]|uniref:Uncharacterized protein n=1 Tax=Ogataea philodendri TaxID=1378263 RepID=A0A9P8T5N6_9ASCO|nr:uncharacterized protein OGAPHI_002837 [Ogataea philodendri]KAH3667188.1 hypothetical protein OGAPHI_002837 [Ogataea philodendri]